MCELAIARINSPRLRLNLRRTLCDSGQKIPVHRATGPFALSWKLGRTLFNRAALWRHENCRSCYYNRRRHPRCVLVLHSALLAAKSEVFAPLQDPTLDALRCDFTAHTATATAALTALLHVRSRTHLPWHDLTTLQTAQGVLLQV